MGITRFSLLGIAAKKASSFVGKAAAAASHPVGLITRFLSLGIGGRRTGAFSGKTPSDSGGTHPVVKITRLSLLGVPAKRAGSFTGKVATDQVLPQRPFAETSGGGYFRHTYPERRINIKDDDEKILFMAVKILLETGRL